MTTNNEMIITYLSIFLPYLIKAGEKAIEEIGENFGEDVWRRAKKIWETFTNKKDDAEEINKTVETIKNNIKDKDAIVKLVEQFEIILNENASFKHEFKMLIELVKETKPTTNITQKSGDDSIQIGQARDVKFIQKD